MTYEDKIKTARYLSRVFLEFESGTAISDKPEDIKWKWIYETAKKHSLTVLMFEALKERIAKEAPPEVYLDFSRDVAIAGAKYIAQKTEFSNLAKLFSENNIAFMPLKGFGIKELYKSPELREMTDIDIFIGNKNIEAAASLMNDAGFKADTSDEVHDSFKKLPFIEIELHKILCREMPDYTMENSIESGGNPYYRLMTEEDFLIFLLHHAKKHDEAGGAGIRAVFDFYLIFKKRTYDEERLEKRIEREGLLDFYKRIRALINFWFYGCDVTPEIFEFEIYTVTGGTYGSLENAFLRKAKKKGRAATFFERLFPPFKAMSMRYPVLKKCPILLPIYYLVRIVVSLFNGRGAKNMRAFNSAGKKEKELKKLDLQNRKTD